MINPLIGMPQGAEWFVILAIVILVFGAAKLPDLARSTGQALKIFKNETKGLVDDDKSENTPADETTSDRARELPSSDASDSATTSGPETTGSSTDRQPG